MNISIAIAIMGYPTRIKYIKEYMLPRLPLSTQVFVDIQQRGVWYNAKRCHNSYNANDTHVLILQDDLLLCKNFINSVIAVVKANPSNIISLYCPSSEALKIQASGKHWMTRNAITGQAMLVPTALEPYWQLWSEKNIPNQDEKQGDDFRISLFCHHTEYKAWYCVPSLVQHIGNRSSTLGYNHPGKYSKVFIGEENSGEDIDWTAGLTSPARMNYYYSEQELRQYGL